MSDQVDQLVYVLATLKNVRHYGSVPTTSKDASERIRLSLLDHIALILATKDKGDVAAVRMKHTGQGLTIFFTKNSPCTNHFKAYVDRIMQIIAKVQDLLNMQMALFKEFVLACGHKFRNRILKCQKELHRFSHVIFHNEGTTNVPNLSGALPEWAGMTAENIIPAFLKNLKDFSITSHSLATQVDTSLGLSQHACLIGIVAQINSIYS
jgi:hypothetical protein